jgi:hypothetical protein
MHNNSAPDSTQSTFDREMIEPGKDRMEKLLGWWYRFTTPPRIATNASFARRDAERRARLMSTICLIGIIIWIVNIPTVLFGTHVTLYCYIAVAIMILSASIANKAGNVILASLIFVAGVEVVIMISITFGYYPLNLTGLQTYGMLIFGELFAASLLSIWSVFIVTAVNIAFCFGDFYYIPHSVALQMSITAIGNPLQTVVQPVSLLIIVACVIGIWVHTATRASERANRAEVIAKVEYAVSEQREQAEREKLELETSIQQLVEAHIATNDGHLNERIPYPPTQILWPLVGVLNTLWARQRSNQQTEHELQHLRQAISACDQAVYHAIQHPEQPWPTLHTGTEIDTLLLSLRRLQESRSQSLH